HLELITKRPCSMIGSMFSAEVIMCRSILPITTYGVRLMGSTGFKKTQRRPGTDAFGFPPWSIATIFGYWEDGPAIPIRIGRMCGTVLTENIGRNSKLSRLGENAMNIPHLSSRISYG